MSSQRMSLAAGALGHLTMPGISLAVIYGFDVTIGALIFLAIGTLLIWLIAQNTKIELETITATVFSTAVATSFLIIPKKKVSIALIGTELSQDKIVSLIVLAATAAAVAVGAKMIYGKMTLINLSPGVASSLGIKTGRVQLLFLTLVSITVALSVRLVGGLLTSALVAIPTASARNISNSLKSYAAWSTIFGASSVPIATLINSLAKSYMDLNLPLGPVIITANGLIFLATLVTTIVKKRSQQ
jgi:ABC-type Mn2+/Zn2+ transport system permease subunit